MSESTFLKVYTLLQSVIHTNVLLTILKEKRKSA